MTEFDDSAPTPRYTILPGYSNGEPDTPLDEYTEELFDALGIANRRHLRARIRYLIAEKEEWLNQNWDNS